MEKRIQRRTQIQQQDELIFKQEREHEDEGAQGTQMGGLVCGQHSAALHKASNKLTPNPLSKLTNDGRSELPEMKGEQWND